jgi:hypothetical protein
MHEKQGEKLKITWEDIIFEDDDFFLIFYLFQQGLSLIYIRRVRLAISMKSKCHSQQILLFYSLVAEMNNFLLTFVKGV